MRIVFVTATKLYPKRKSVRDIWISAGHLGGRGLRPDPLDSLADPLHVFENINAGCKHEMRAYFTVLRNALPGFSDVGRNMT